MILERLTLNNFGLYGGENKFDLSPAAGDERPVILVRGHNGGGKTTFLEAVRLALYGKRALGARVAQSDYKAYLLQRIYALAEEKSASVTLSFSRHEGGKTVHYEVRRAWAARGTSVVDTIELTCDGVPVGQIPPEDWDHHLEDLIPSGISQFFFFDGEKIQDIADDATPDGLRDAIRSLLGLDLIDQLRGDLAIYTARRDSSGTDVNIESIERDWKKAKEELNILQENAAQVREKRVRADRQIAKAQKAFDAEGGSAALNRSGLEQSLKEMDNRIGRLQSDLKRLAESPLPLGLAPNLMEWLNGVVSQDGFTTGAEAIGKFLEAFETNERTKSTKGQIWTEGHFCDLKEYLNESCDDMGKIVLDADPAWIKNRIGVIDEELRGQAADLGRELDMARERQAQLKSQLQNFDAGAAKKTLETLKTAEYERGRAEAQLVEREKAISSLIKRIGQLEKERDHVLDVEFDRTQAIHKIDLGNRTRVALATYETRVLERRIISLSNRFVGCFNGLIRKKRLLSSVRIDPHTFDIVLVGAEGVEISKEALSAGERQIFAISMLWALGKTSGRELPMIIDTPLSRLDRMHQNSFMRDYVPEASQQIILLCTDSELTPDLDKLISPFVARRYEIGVFQGDRQTQVMPREPAELYAN